MTETRGIPADERATELWIHLPCRTRSHAKGIGLALTLTTAWGMTEGLIRVERALGQGEQQRCGGRGKPGERRLLAMRTIQ